MWEYAKEQITREIGSVADLGTCIATVIAIENHCFPSNCYGAMELDSLFASAKVTVLTLGKLHLLSCRLRRRLVDSPCGMGRKRMRGHA
jgi:hypothetical protein